MYFLCFHVTIIVITTTRAPELRRVDESTCLNLFVFWNLCARMFQAKKNQGAHLLSK